MCSSVTSLHTSVELTQCIRTYQPIRMSHDVTLAVHYFLTGEGVCMMIKKTHLLEKLISHEATNGG